MQDGAEDTAEDKGTVQLVNPSPTSPLTLIQDFNSCSLGKAVPSPSHHPSLLFFPILKKISALKPSLNTLPSSQRQGMAGECFPLCVPTLLSCESFTQRFL